MKNLSSVARSSKVLATVEVTVIKKGSLFLIFVIQGSKKEKERRRNSVLASAKSWSGLGLAKVRPSPVFPTEIGMAKVRPSPVFPKIKQ